MGSTNNQIKTLRRLCGRRSVRSELQKFVIEGPTLVAEALGSQSVSVLNIYADESCEEFISSHDEAAVVEEGVLASVLSTNNPQPVCAVASYLNWGTHDVLDASKHLDAPILVLHEVNDPGNVGTIFRAAEASGLAGVVLGDDSVDIYNPKTVRASAGSMFRLPFAAAGTAEFLAMSSADGLESYATVIDGGTAYTETQLNKRSVIVFGNEARGLDASTEALCSSKLSIPMAGETESLNVAMAATVVGFESLRQRREDEIGAKPAHG